jgi:hypothetical protein
MTAMHLPTLLGPIGLHAGWNSGSGILAIVSDNVEMRQRTSRYQLIVTPI